MNNLEKLGFDNWFKDRVDLSGISITLPSLFP
jgi:hypothetical protein